MEVHVFFEDHKSVIASELEKSQKVVIIAVAWINFKEYYQIFEELLDRSVKLTIICSDNPQNKSHLKEIMQLRAKKAQIKLLQMPLTRNHMHHKFAVVDGSVLLNGSFNWSPNAEKSFENLMVIKECPSEISKFNDEFNRILEIEKDTIKYLQKKKKCKCGGEILNVLVFSDRSSNFETWGDIVSFCNSCEDFVAVEAGISNNRLYTLANDLNFSENDYDYEYFQSRIAEELNQYTNGNITLHGIGKVVTGLDFHDEDFMNIEIIWKNKFVGERLPDIIYDQNFDVYYDH